MTTHDFLDLIKQPDEVKVTHEPDLKELIEKYPYFCQPRLLWLKSLKMSESIHFDSQLSLTSLYVADRQSLFFYLNPEKKLKEPKAVQDRRTKFSGSYFDWVDAVEEGNGQLSLKQIAEKLKNARQLIAQDEKTLDSINTTNRNDSDPFRKSDVLTDDYFNYDAGGKEVDLEEKSKYYIKHKKYKEAIAILNQLNLNNPKKSIYFADQIRFLEKIIAYSKVTGQ